MGNRLGHQPSPAEERTLGHRFQTSGMHTTLTRVEDGLAGGQTDSSFELPGQSLTN